MWPFFEEALRACNPKHKVDQWLAKHQPEEAEFLAIDCEMVVTTVVSNCLARVSMTNKDEAVLDELVQPRGKVKNYLTKITGIDKTVLKKAKFTYPEIQNKVLEFLQPQTIWVGHDCIHDLRSLGFEQLLPNMLFLDSCKLFSYKGYDGYYPALTDLCYIVLGLSIHDFGASHDSVIDSRASWYLTEFVLTHGIQNIKPPRFVLEKWGFKANGTVCLIENLPKGVSAGKLESFFSKYGTVHVKLGKSGYCEIEFEDDILKIDLEGITFEGQLLKIVVIGLPSITSQNKKRKRNEFILKSPKRRRLESIENLINADVIFDLKCDEDLDKEANFEIFSSDDEVDVTN